MTVKLPDSVALYKSKAPRKRAGGYAMEATADGTPKVRLFGPIDSWERTAEQFAQDLDALAATGATEADFEINSLGGSVFEAFAIYDTVKASPIKFRAVILGVAASAASLISCACAETVVGKNARFMIHEPETGTWGRVKDLREVADMLESMRLQGAEIYAARSGQPVNIIEGWMAETKWMRGQEIVDLGFANAVLDIDGKMELDEDALRDLDNVPMDLIEAVQAEAEASANAAPVQEETAPALEEQAPVVETPAVEPAPAAPVVEMAASPAATAKMQAASDPVVAALKSEGEQPLVSTARKVEAAQDKPAMSEPAPWAMRVAEMNRNFGRF
jgi:ATP-dependent protease ClpP protease subunit